MLRSWCTPLARCPHGTAVPPLGISHPSLQAPPGALTPLTLAETQIWGQNFLLGCHIPIPRVLLPPSSRAQRLVAPWVKSKVVAGTRCGVSPWHCRVRQRAVSLRPAKKGGQGQEHRAGDIGDPVPAPWGPSAGTVGTPWGHWGHHGDILHWDLVPGTLGTLRAAVGMQCGAVRDHTHTLGVSLGTFWGHFGVRCWGPCGDVTSRAALLGDGGAGALTSRPDGRPPARQHGGGRAGGRPRPALRW